MGVRPLFIDTIEAPSPEQFVKVVARGRPALIRQAVADWNAISRWGTEYFETMVGGRRVPIEFYPSGSYYQSRLVFDATMKRYLELLQARDSKEKYYLAEVPIDEHLSELCADISLPPFLDERRLIFRAFFFGKDSVSNLHFHSTTQALLCQVFGRKKVTLYPPEALPFLYFYPWYKYWFNFSRIHFDRLDMSAYPQFHRATSAVCTLEPGDALFIPMHWGHLVEGFDLNASITFFWRSRWREWTFHRAALRARLGSSFRTLVSGPAAKFCEHVFGFRIVR